MKKKMLIIDDDADVVEVIGFVFGNTEFDLVVSHGVLPVEEIIRINPSLVLLDYWLEEGFGDKICLEMKGDSRARHIPVILFSAYHNLKRIADGCCADAFIEKPFDVAELEAKVREMAL
jgi:DNA-binding response OmpR family regulator